MKYLSQFLIIMGFTLAGEALQRLIPVSIPASVYGLVLLFAALPVTSLAANVETSIFAISSLVTSLSGVNVPLFVPETIP